MDLPRYTSPQVRPSVIENFLHNPIHDRVLEVDSLALDRLDKISEEKTVERRAARKGEEWAEEHKRDRHTMEKKDFPDAAHLLEKISVPRVPMALPREKQMCKNGHKPLSKFVIQKAGRSREARAPLLLEEARTKLRQVLLDYRELHRAMRRLNKAKSLLPLRSPLVVVVPPSSILG